MLIQYDHLHMKLLQALSVFVEFVSSSGCIEINQVTYVTVVLANSNKRLLRFV